MHVETPPPHVDSHMSGFGVGMMVTDVVLMEVGDGLGMAGVEVTIFGVTST